MIKTYFLLMVLFASSVFAQYSSLDIPEDLKTNASVVIREDHDVFTFKSINDMSITRKRVVMLLDKSADLYSTIAIPYSPNYRVSDIKVNVYNLLGKKIKSYSKKDFSDFTNNQSNALYVDDRVLLLKINSTSYPFTIESSYEVNTSNTIGFGTFMPFSDYNVSVQNTSYTINNTSGIKVREKISDNALGKVAKTQEGNTTTYQYSHIPALKKESLAPTIAVLVPKVELSPERFTLEGNQGDLATWDDFGKWYYSKLIEPVSQITPQIQQEVQALNLTGTTEDKVKKLYQYMQDKTRYVLISMGIGGWKPMPANEVSQKGYGDCKALTNYMRTLLSAAGIPAYYAVIYDGRTEQTFDANFPELNGNHAVLMVPTENGNIWLENTNQKVAFNHLFYTSHNRNVALVKENGIEIVNTPVYLPQQSREVLDAKIQLTEDLGMKGTLNLLFTGGQYDGNLYLTSLKNEQLNDRLKEEYYHLKISDIAVKNLVNNRDKAEISYELNLTTRDFSKKLGSDLFFPVVPFSETTALVSNEERVLPFEISFPYQNDFQIEYAAPEGFQFTEIPTSSEFKSEFGSYKIDYELVGSKLKVNRIVTVNKGLYPKEKYNDFVAFTRKIANADNTKILITKP